MTKNFGVLFILSLFCTHTYASDSGSKLYRIIPMNQVQLQALSSFHASNGNKLDFWSAPSGLNRSVDVMVSGGSDEESNLCRVLSDSKSPFEIKDLDSLVESESNANRPRLSQFRSSVISSFALDRYHSYGEIVGFLDDLARQSPSLVKLINIGQSSENRELLALKIGSPSSSKKKAFLIDGGIHAREWLSPATAIFIANQLVSDYSSQPRVKQLLDQVDFYIIPLVNPDGYEFSRTQNNRFWRKNRSRQQCTWSWYRWRCCNGADLNRNFNIQFGGAETSNDACQDTFGGKQAFSEVESKALSQFMLKMKDQFKAYITLHSYGQMWLVPYGYASAAYPSDYDELLQAAQDGARAVQAVHGTQYTVGNTVDVLYPAAGGSDDWAKAVAGIKFVYTIELRPGDSGSGFVLEPSQIIPTGQEIYEGVKVIGERVMSIS